MLAVTARVTRITDRTGFRGPDLVYVKGRPVAVPKKNPATEILP